MARFSNGGNEDDDGEGFQRSPRKSIKFFEYGDISADSKNYDYAVECYIGGLRHEPDNIDRHKQLHEIAIRRGASGGKPAEAKTLGPSLVDKMLKAEMAWAYDHKNLEHMIEVIKTALEADCREGENANLIKVAYWMSCLATERNGENPKG